MSEISKAVRHLFFLVVWMVPVVGWAQCAGRNVLDDMSTAQLAELQVRTDRNPYAEGRYFEVSKGNATSVLFGTIHLNDEEVATPPSALVERLQTARLLLVEVTKAETERLEQLIVTNPMLIIAKDGARLRPSLTTEEWAELEATLAPYGIPAPAADRIAPWFLTIMLSTPACILQSVEAGTPILDHRIQDVAEAADVPVEGLETIEVVFEIVGGGTHADHVKMLRASLPAFALAEDYLATTRALYLDDQIMKIWALGQMIAEESIGIGAAEDLMAQFEDRLLIRRNDLWMDRLVPELTQGDVVVAVGALHLGGENGLLQLLADQGFEVRRITD